MNSETLRNALRQLVLLAVLAGLLAGCGQVVNPSTRPAGSSGGTARSLTVLVEGLPEGVTPNIDVHGPDGYAQHLDGPTKLTALTSGTYSVDALGVNADGTSYLAERPHQQAEVGDSSGAVVVVEYIELRPVIAEGTVALPSHGPAANTLREMDFVGMEHDRLISSFTFDPVPPELEDLEVGGFLALGISDANPYGFLGEVLALDRRGNALYVEAARVLMEEVIQQGAGSIHASFGADDIDLDAVELLAEGVTLLAPDHPDAVAAALELSALRRERARHVTPLSRDGAAALSPGAGISPQQLEVGGRPICVQLNKLPLYSGDDGAVIGDGTLCFTATVSVDLGFSLDKGIYAYFKASADQSGDFRVYGDGWFTVDEHFAVPFIKIPLGTISFTIGYVPIVIQPMLSVNLDVGGGIKGQFHLDVTEHFSLTGGIRHEWDGWDKFGSHGGGATLDTAGTVEGFRVLAGAGPQLNFYFYGVYGPNIALSSFLEYEAIFEADPWWRLYLGMRPYIGVNANLSMPKEGELMARVTEGLVGKIISKVLNYQVKLFEVKVQLAQAPPKQKPVLVDLEPKSVTMRPCTPTMFSASLEGATNERVTWHVSGGSITPDGLDATFVSPMEAGTYTVTAKSFDQPGQQYQATVEVEGGVTGLYVGVHNLPPGVPANVVVTGPDGFHRVVTESTRLDCIQPGEYTVTAGMTPTFDYDRAPDGFNLTPNLSFDLGGRSDAPAPVVSHTFDLQEGDFGSLGVNYNSMFTRLIIEVEGLPDPGAATARLTGPFGFERSFQGGHTFEILSPGEYTLVVPPVEAGGHTYSPKRTEYALSLVGGTTETINLEFSSSTAPVLHEFAADTQRLPEAGGDVRLEWDGLNISRYELAVSPSAGVLVDGRAYDGPAVFDGAARGATLTLPAATGGLQEHYRLTLTGRGDGALTDTAGLELAVDRATRGGLNVEITGLPGGLRPQVRVTGPGGFEETLEGSARFDRVAPGTYLVRSEAVMDPSGEFTYDPPNRISLVEVSPGREASARVEYEPVSGIMELTVTPPPGSMPELLLVGPGTYLPISEPGTHRFTDLPRGAYHLRAPAQREALAEYTATVTPASVTVEGGATTSVEAAYGTTQGAIRLDSTLPAGVDAYLLSLTGPVSYTVHAPAGEHTLAYLPVGDYQLSAANLSSGGATYAPTTGTVSVSVTPGGLATAEFGYAQTSGSLAVTFTGVPDGYQPSARLTGPGISANLWGDSTLTGLAPGSYTVTANPITGARYTYAPSGPASADVAAAELSAAVVGYAPDTGALELELSAPPGVAPDVEVSGAGGYQERIARGGRALLAHLPPGEYEVRSASVAHGGENYSPDVALTTVTVEAGRTAVAGVAYAPTSGSLRLTTEMPAGVTATPHIVIYDAAGAVARVVDRVGATTLDGLPEGDYTVVAQERRQGNAAFVPEPAEQEVTVTRAATASATVAYRAVSGGLRVNVTGAPAGLSPRVRVAAAAGGFDTVLTESATLANLQPGEYGVTADVLEDEDGTTFEPTIDGSPAVVTAGETTTVTVNYAQVTGDLEVVVEGLPDGEPASVRVTGEGLDAQVTATEILRGLAPGRYAIEPRDVTTGGAAPETFRGVVQGPDQVEVVEGGLTSATVTYAQVTGGVTLTVTAPDGVTPNIDLLDADGTPVRTVTETGAVAITNLPEGTYTIRPNDVPAHGETFAGATPDGAEVTVTAAAMAAAGVEYHQASGNLELAVTVPAGVAPRVELVGADDEVVYTLDAPPAGADPILIRNLPPGEYELRAHDVEATLGGGPETYRAQVTPTPSVTIEAGQVARRDVTYELFSAALELTITAPEGVVPNVALNDAEGRFLGRFEATGVHRVHNLTPGEYEIRVSAVSHEGNSYVPKGNESQRNFTVSVGETARMDVEYVPNHGSLLVTTNLPDGADAPLYFRGETIVPGALYEGLSIGGSFLDASAGATHEGETYAVAGEGSSLFPVQIRPGLTTRLHLEYALTSSRLAVTVTGLDAGVVELDVGGEQYALTPGENLLRGLEPGTHSLSATAPAGFYVVLGADQIALGSGETGSLSILVAELIDPRITGVTQSADRVGPLGSAFGESVTLTWSSTDAEQFTLESSIGGVEGLPEGPTTDTSVTLQLPANTGEEARAFAFTLTAHGKPGSVPDTRVVNVAQNPMYTRTAFTRPTSRYEFTTEAVIDAEGNVWFGGYDFVDASRGHLYVLRNGASSVAQVASLGGWVRFITYDSERHKLWIAVEIPQNGRLVEYDIASGARSNHTISGYPLPRGIAIDDDGHIWLATAGYGRETAIQRFNTTSRGFDLSISLPGGQQSVYGLAVTGETLWALDATDRVVHEIGIGSGTPTMVDSHPIPGANLPGFVARDDGGNLWITDMDAGGIVKFDTGTRTAQRFLTDSRVEGVTTLDGLVWLARSEAGQIAAIDPLTNESVRFDAHGAPNGIAGRVGPNGERWLAFVSGGAWGDPEVVTVHFE